MENSNELAKLVQRILSGESEAFDELYLKTYKAAFFHAKKVLKNEQDAEDAVAEGYMRAYENLSRLQQPEAVQAWICRIVTNIALNMVRDNRYGDAASLDDEDFFYEPVAPESETPDLVLDKKATEKLIGSMIDALPEVQRTAVMLYYFDEMSVGQIASVMGCSEGTVKSRLNYARKHLQEAVLAEEKRGVKLYSVSPALLLASIRRLIGAETVSSAAYWRVAQALADGCGYVLTESGKAVAASGVRKAAAKAAAGTAKKAAVKGTAKAVGTGAAKAGTHAAAAKGAAAAAVAVKTGVSAKAIAIAAAAVLTVGGAATGVVVHNQHAQLPPETPPAIVEVEKTSTEESNISTYEQTDSIFSSLIDKQRRWISREKQLDVYRQYINEVFFARPHRYGNPEDCRFALFDFDDDGIDELFVFGFLSYDDNRIYGTIIDVFPKGGEIEHLDIGIQNSGGQDSSYEKTSDPYRLIDDVYVSARLENYYYDFKEDNQDSFGWCIISSNENSWLADYRKTFDLAKASYESSDIVHDIRFTLLNDTDKYYERWQYEMAYSYYDGKTMEDYVQPDICGEYWWMGPSRTPHSEKLSCTEKEYYSLLSNKLIGYGPEFDGQDISMSYDEFMTISADQIKLFNPLMSVEPFFPILTEEKLQQLASDPIEIYRNATSNITDDDSSINYKNNYVTLYDLDGNGTEEMFVKYFLASANGGAVKLEVYTIQNNNAVLLYERRCEFGNGDAWFALCNWDGKDYLASINYMSDIWHNEEVELLDLKTLKREHYITASTWPDSSDFSITLKGCTVDGVERSWDEYNEKILNAKNIGDRTIFTVYYLKEFRNGSAFS